MQRVLAPFALLAFTLGARASAQLDDAARIVPADAAVLVRLESAQAWNELVHAFAPLAGPEAASFDLQRTLDGLASAEADPATLPRLDPARPLYLAVSFDPASGPALTFAVPVSNGQAFQLQPTFGPLTSVVVGSYAAVTNRAEFVASATPSALLSTLRPGLVSVRVDLARLIAAFRPLIEMGLAQAEGALDELPSEGMPFDVQPMMEAYLEAARDMIDTARAVELALERRGEQLSLRIDYSASAERAPAPVLADLGPLLGLMDPASPVQLVFNGKWTEYLRSFEELMDAALEMYPEPLQADLRRLLAQQALLDALLAPGMVTSFDLGAAGLRTAYFVRSTQPEELMTALEEMLRSLDHEGGLVRLGPSERLPIDGLEARVFTAEIRYETLFAMLAQIEPDAGAVEPAELAQMRETLQAFYGETLRLAFARRGEIVAVCVAANDSELRADLARLDVPAQPAPKVLALLEQLEPGALGFAYHLDLGKFAGRLADSMQGLAPEATFFPDVDFALDFWAGVRGATWSGGVSMSLAEVLAFVEEMRVLDGR